MPADAATVVALMRKFAKYAGEDPAGFRQTEADILRDGFGEKPKFEMRVAELDGQVVGYVLFYQDYAAWDGSVGIYVENLYVLEDARGHGLGRKLLAAVAAEAVKRDIRRIELDVLDDNPTRRFYDHLGMRALKEWLPYRMSGSAMQRLAEEGAPAN